MSSDIQRLPRLEVVALIESRAREARARQGLGTLALFRCFAPSPRLALLPSIDGATVSVLSIAELSGAQSIEKTEVNGIPHHAIFRHGLLQPGTLAMPQTERRSQSVSGPAF